MLLNENFGDDKDTSGFPLVKFLFKKRRCQYSFAMSSHYKQIKSQV